MLREMRQQSQQIIMELYNVKKMRQPSQQIIMELYNVKKNDNKDVLSIDILCLLTNSFVKDVRKD